MKTLEEQSQKNRGAEGKQWEGEEKSQCLEKDKINLQKISGILRLCKNFLSIPSCVFLPSVTDLCALPFKTAHPKVVILATAMDLPSYILPHAKGRFRKERRLSRGRR